MATWRWLSRYWLPRSLGLPVLCFGTEIQQSRWLPYLAREHRPPLSVGSLGDRMGLRPCASRDRRSGGMTGVRICPARK